MKRRPCKHNIQDVISIKCPYCNKDDFKMLHWGHLKKIHSKTLDDVLNEFPNIPTMTKQESDRRSEKRIECDKKITETCNNKYGGVGFLSSKLKEKTINSIQEKFGQTNIMRVEKVAKKFRGKDGIVSTNKIRSERISKSLKGKPSPLKGKSYEEILGIEKATRRRKEQKVFGALGMSLSPRISKPQLELYNLVKQIYPDAILEYPFLDYCIDIAVPNKNLCFEYDGSYWHDQERDKERDRVLEREGWKTFRFIDRLPSLDEIKSLQKF